MREIFLGIDEFFITLSADLPLFDTLPVVAALDFPRMLLLLIPLPVFYTLFDTLPVVAALDSTPS